MGEVPSRDTREEREAVMMKKSVAIAVFCLFASQALAGEILGPQITAMADAIQVRLDAIGSGPDLPKVEKREAKKLAKAAAKAAKKGAPIGTAPPAGTSTPAAGGRSPAERSAEAAERQVALQRWRVALALIAAAIALVTLLVMLTR